MCQSVRLLNATVHQIGKGGRGGTGVMWDKAIFSHSRKTKNDKKLLFSQQLQLTTKQIGTQHEQHGFFLFGDIRYYGFS